MRQCIKGFYFAGLVFWSLTGHAEVSSGPPTIEFVKDVFTVNENARTAIVIIKRSGNTNSAVSVDFATSDGTATAGIDYVAYKGSVTIPAGKTEAKVQIQIKDDLQAEADETVKLALGNPSGGAVLGAQSAAELLIINNHSGKAAWLTFGLDRIELFQQPVFGIPLWQYVASLIYIFLAFYVSKFLDHVIRVRLKKWAEKTATQFDDILLELLRGPLKIIAFVILLHLGLRVFPWPEWAEHSLSKGLLVVVAVSITFVVLKLVDVLLGYWKQHAASPEDEQFHKQLLPIIRNSLKAFVVIVALLVTLQNLGLNITSLITSLGIGGLALALAAQDTLANFFGAIAVLLDKPFRIGDRIQLDHVDGTVEAIGLRSTRVRNQDGHLVSIPNKALGNATITNVSLRPNIRTLINIGITYDTPPEKIERAVAILNDVYRHHPMTHDVWISFNKFADFSLNIFVVHWWKSIDFKGYLEGMHELNLKIKERFDQEGIQFAFPTQTVYTKQDSDRKLSGPPLPPQATGTG